MYYDNIISIALHSNIQKVTINGKECYMIREKNMVGFVDRETGLVVKGIDNESNTLVDRFYDIVVVQDSDIAKPDISEYEVNLGYDEW